MKKRSLIILFALVLVACTKNPSEKPAENSGKTSQTSSTESGEEPKKEGTEGMALLKLTESEGLKIQADFNRFGGRNRAILHEGTVYFSRIHSLVRSGRIQEFGELYRMNEDGSELMKLSDDAATSLTVAGSYLYYVNLSDYHTLYRMKLDGSERERLNDYCFSEFVVDEDRIYFAGQDGPHVYDGFATHSPRYFGRIKTDGSDYRIILKGDFSFLSTDDEYLYAHYFNNALTPVETGIIRYSLQDLQTEAEPEKLKPTTIKDVDLPYAVLKDGSILTAEVSETDVYEDSSNRVKLRGRDGTVKTVKDLRFEDRFLNLFDGKIYTVRIKNWHEAEESETTELQKTLYAIDESGEKELFAYERDEWNFAEMIGTKILCNHNNMDDLYLLNTETGEMKQILEATPPSEKK